MFQSESTIYKALLECVCTTLEIARLFQNEEINLTVNYLNRHMPDAINTFH